MLVFYNFATVAIFSYILVNVANNTYMITVLLSLTLLHLQNQTIANVFFHKTICF